MSENNNPQPIASESQPIASESQPVASESQPVAPKTSPLAPKSPTIAEIVQRATVELDGLGLNDALLREAETLCEAAMTGIAASSLHAVVSKHISQLVPAKPTRKPRKGAADTQAVP